MDLTFQVPMQYCSSQHRTLLLSAVTSTTGQSTPGRVWLCTVEALGEPCPNRPIAVPVPTLLDSASSILQKPSHPESSLCPSACLAQLYLQGTAGSRWGSASPGLTSHLGKGMQTRKGQSSPLHAYLLFTSCQGGSPIKWLSRDRKSVV